MNKSDPARMPELFNLGWSLSMLAVGLEPLDARESDFVIRSSRSILIGVNLLLISALVGSVRRLRSQTIGSRQGKKLVIQLVLLAIVDLSLVGALLFVWFPQNNDTLSNLLREKPDLGLLCTLLVVLTLGWGTIRSLTFLIRLSEQRYGRRSHHE